MRRFAVILSIFAMTGMTGPAAAADCTGEVKAAFQKQIDAQKYRVSMSQPTAEGPIQMTVDYQLPDKMLQTVTAPHMPGEQQTMLVGERAFAGSGGGFEELLPHFTQSVVAEFRSATSPAGQVVGSFECLGKQTVDGKDYVAYRTADRASASGDKTLARTIYVDVATGRPALNVVAELSGKTEPVLKAAYSYPTDIDIVAPEGAPAQAGPR